MTLAASMACVARRPVAPHAWPATCRGASEHARSSVRDSTIPVRCVRRKGASAAQQAGATVQADASSPPPRKSACRRVARMGWRGVRHSATGKVTVERPNSAFAIPMSARQTARAAIPYAHQAAQNANRRALAWREAVACSQMVPNARWGRSARTETVLTASAACSRVVRPARNAT